MRIISFFLAVVILALTAPHPTFAANSHYATFTSTANKNLSRTDTATISITGNLTIQFAVRFSGTPSDTQGLITVYPSTASNRSYMCQRNTDNKIYCQVSNGTTAYSVTSTTALSTGSWYCVAFIYIPSTSVKLYISNAGCTTPPAEDASNTTSIPASINDSTGTLRLGAYDAFVGTAATVYAGDMDEVRLWAANRTNDIASDYNCVITTTPPNLNAYWKLDNALTDSSGNGNTLTNNGSVAFNSASPPFTADCPTGTSDSGIFMQFE